MGKSPRTQGAQAAWRIKGQRQRGTRTYLSNAGHEDQAEDLQGLKEGDEGVSGSEAPSGSDGSESGAEEPSVPLGRQALRVARLCRAEEKAASPVKRKKVRKVRLMRMPSGGESKCDDLAMDGSLVITWSQLPGAKEIYRYSPFACDYAAALSALRGVQTDPNLEPQLTAAGRALERKAQA